MSVIVDDADRSIAYEDAWTVPNPQSLGAASYSGINQSIGGTLHGARVTNPSNVSLLSIPSLVYEFNGTSISMFAIMSREAQLAATKGQYWQCQINLVPTTPIDITDYGEAATVKICSGVAPDNTENVQFEFFLINNVAGQQNDILFDYLEYIPLPSSVLEAYSFISIDSNDEGIIYDGDWRPDAMNNGDDGKIASEGTASAEYHFNGTSITCLGGPLGSVAADASSSSTASFTIDGQESSTIQLLPPQTSSLNYPSRTIVFQSSKLDPSVPHALKIIYTDSVLVEEQASLFLHSLVIGGSTLPPSNFNVVPNNTVTATHSFTSLTSSDSLVTETFTPPTSTTSGHPSQQAPIQRSHSLTPLIVGVVAGLLLIICATALLVWRRRKKNTTDLEVIQPFPSSPDIPRREVSRRVSPGAIDPFTSPSEIPQMEDQPVAPRTIRPFISPSMTPQMEVARLVVPGTIHPFTGPLGTQEREVDHPVATARTIKARRQQLIAAARPSVAIPPSKLRSAGASTGNALVDIAPVTPAPNVYLVIPPSKLRRDTAVTRRVNTSVNVAPVSGTPVDSAPQDSRTSNGAAHTQLSAAVNTTNNVDDGVFRPQRIARTFDIQEEDSGLRYVEEDAEEEVVREINWVLPPAYTAA